jgi:4a-hydroxytetrahydrobiopterin dehydratase
MTAADRLDRDAAEAVLALESSVLLREWSLAEDHSGDASILSIQRVYSKFGNFIRAMEFANRITEMAEGETHHPTLTVSWGQVKVVWYSFSVGGLHMNDLVCAKKTQEIYDDMMAAATTDGKK